MPLINFSSLDFDQIKSSLREVLKANANFTDYDFEGSNLSSIIDLLAYNTYITSYNANMVANEVFIDSATLRENVVALAKNIGYTPKSRKASRCNINFLVDTSGLTVTPPSVTLKAGPVVSTSNQFGTDSYVFNILEDTTVSVTNNVANFNSLQVIEGTRVTQTFTYSARNPNQRYLLTNAGIDTDTIKVSVKPSTTSTIKVDYDLNNSLIDQKVNNVINGNSTVYFLQEVEDERYEIIFGDGVFGKALEDGNSIEVSYLVCDGANANRVSNFNFSGRLVYLQDSVENAITGGISQVITDSPSTGGAAIESVASIKKYAPQVYGTQDRAITANDYEILIPNKIYPEAESISVFGGEELVPPRFGKVFISIKPRNGDFVSLSIKENIKRELRRYSVTGIVPEILDLKYLYVVTNSKVYYNTRSITDVASVSSTIQNNIQAYADSPELNKYGTRFKYSKFLGIIDQSHPSITSNITSVQMRRDLRLATNQFAEYAIDFGNHMHVQYMTGFNIKSSSFRVLDITDDVYLFDEPNDTKTGTISLYSLQAPGSTTPVVRRRNVGAINYMTGRITLNPINIVSGKDKDGVQIMEIFAVPHSNDVIGYQDLYLQLDDFNVEMIVDDISSGSDPSGSNYKSSASYVDVNNNQY
ncbi:baseplate wedge [Synechococcus phage SynMITS9220M01]|nr:baseplate wedge [Synechococcus phage SynMITS9220M01]